MSAELVCFGWLKWIRGNPSQQMGSEGMTFIFHGQLQGQWVVWPNLLSEQTAVPDITATDNSSGYLKIEGLPRHPH